MQYTVDPAVLMIKWIFGVENILLLTMVKCSKVLTRSRELTKLAAVMGV